MPRMKYTPHWNGLFYRARVGPVKRNWKKVRTFILRIPRLPQAKKTSCKIKVDDMGCDFIREMSFTDAMASALATMDDAKKVTAVSEASVSYIAKIFAQGAAKLGVAKVVLLEEKEQEVLRQYMRLGYAEDELFCSLAQKWPTHSIEMRLQQMTKLALPRAIFLSPSPDVEFDCFLNAMAERRSIQSALKYLFKKRCTRKYR